MRGKEGNLPQHKIILFSQSEQGCGRLWKAVEVPQCVQGCAKLWNVWKVVYNAVLGFSRLWKVVPGL